MTGRSAWVRLFSEQTAEIKVTLPDGTVVPLERGLSLMMHPDRDTRREAADAITEGLAPGLRTRAFIFNTLLADKATDDRLRHYPTWITSRNLANQATDESVEALVDAVKRRYDIPQRWYEMKKKILGLPRLADYDRYASVGASETEVGWVEAREMVLDSYASFSPELATLARRFFDERWIDAPLRPGKRPGAFCAYTVPSHHPYVFLNWTAKRNDVLTLAHELGHGLHGHLAREQGVFHQSTPLTLAETASVFGETVTFGRLLASTDDPQDRLALLAESIEGAIATVFRQTAMNRFEQAMHTARRAEGELSVDRLGDLWAESQTEMLGDAVEITDGYRSWWSYIPHFVGTPGYVYAYAYGQLLAMSVYHRYETQGSDFVPRVPAPPSRRRLDGARRPRTHRRVRSRRPRILGWRARPRREAARAGRGRSGGGGPAGLAFGHERPASPKSRAQRSPTPSSTSSATRRWSSCPGCPSHKASSRRSR